MIFVVFIAALMGCVLTGISVVYALAFGLGLFVFGALRRGYAPRDVLKMSWDGAKRAKNMVLMFFLIGMLTGIWRACGTIPWIVYYSTGLIAPRYFMLSAFLLSCMMGILTGSSLGTTSTMGSVLMIVAALIGADPLVTAGAVLSGAFLGDRVSPMASCARLVCDATGTDYYDNIKQWGKTAVLPLLLSAGAYLCFRGPAGARVQSETIAEIAASFQLPVVVALPAMLLLILAVFKVNVKLNMLLGVLLGAVLSVAVQGSSLVEMLSAVVFGLQLPAGHPLAAMMNGGGLVSMLRAAFIVFFSSAYIGIFEATGMLSGIERFLGRMAGKLGVYLTTLITSLFAIGFSCNQTLAVMLTNQLCRKNYADKYELADDLSNTAVLVAGLVPWSISCAIPLSVLGVDASALPFAFYVLFGPLVQLVYRHRHPVKKPVQKLQEAAKIEE